MIDAVEVITGRSEAPFAICCEHAGNALPAPWRWDAADAWLKETHWAYDIGAAGLARQLAAVTGAPAVLAKFTRLLVDPNRPEDAATLFLREAEGKTVALNREVDAAERERRLAYWRAYHDAVDAMLGACRAPVIFAVHSFTPRYHGVAREVDIGVLFDREEALASALLAALAPLGAAPRSMQLRPNEPYSGRQGLIYSADRHAARHGRRALEIEVRQDHLSDERFVRELCAILTAFSWVAL